MDKIKKLTKMIEESQNIVFFGGAGVSTESGIPDYRSKNGLYNLNLKYSPEEMLSHNFFINKPEIYFDFHRKRIIGFNAKPNFAHKALVELEKMGKLKAIITQNIDGLHSLAGSKNVLELHGNSSRNYCVVCNKSYTKEYIINNVPIPKCEDCGNIIKPDIVLYGESLNNDTIKHAINSVSNADMLIIGGTSLVVYPAASFINFFSGKYLVIINKEETPKDKYVDLVIRESIGEVFKKVLNELKK